MVCRRVGRRLSAAAKTATTPTYSFQDHLPPLPIPPLDQTFNRYIEWSRPIMTPEQHLLLTQAVSDFRTSGLAERMQLALLDHRREAGKNWLEPLWDDMYLGDRGPQPLSAHYNFVLDPLPPSLVSQGSPAIAAALVESLVAFREEISSHAYPPNLLRDIPLCMAQFTKLFGGSRIPAPQRDQWISHDNRTSSTSFDPSGSAPRHMIVVRLGRSFVVPIYKEDGTPRATAHIHADLRAVHSAAPAKHCGPSVFAGGPREEAAVARAQLLDNGNAAALAAVESALCVVVLDEDKDSSDQAVAWAGLAGSPRSRWYDKPLQVVVTDGGRVTTVQEHSPMDGHTVVQLVSKMAQDAASRYGAKDVPLVSDGEPFEIRGSTRDERKPKSVAAHPPDVNDNGEVIVPSRGELLFRMPNNLVNAAEASETAFIQRAEGFTVVDLEAAVGASAAKAARVSPDFVAQLLFQAAYVSTYGAPGQTYESCMTKRFHHGRTETLRPVSEAMVACIDQLQRGDVDPTAFGDAVRVGSEEHRKRSKLCADGQGVDRHLLGLKTMCERHSAELGDAAKPAIFFGGSEGVNTYAIYKTDLLSTSSLAAQGVSAFAFAPTSETGFGIGYSVKPNSIKAFVSAQLPSVMWKRVARVVWTRVLQVELERWVENIHSLASKLQTVLPAAQ